MLKVNIISFVISLIMTFITTVLLKNLDLAILSIVVFLVNSKYLKLLIKNP